MTVTAKKYPILKVLVGSHAHGLATPESDFDYRGVFVLPTKQLLTLGSKIEQTSWIDPETGNLDDTSWEIGKFLLMATKSNPTVLETFLATRADKDDITEKEYEFGEELRALFPHIWSSQYVKDAFIGYGLNQRKKFFDDKDGRKDKYATAYLRTLYQAHELLSTGTFSVNMSKTPVFELLKNFKKGNYQVGEVIQACWEWENQVLKDYKQNPDKQVNLEPVNEFLLKVRKHFWEE